VADYISTTHTDEDIDFVIGVFHAAASREKHIGGLGGSLDPPGPLLEPPGPLLTHLHTVYMVYSEGLLTRLNPLAERTCFSQAARQLKAEEPAPGN
jgi:hypothetical protein